MHEYPLHFKCGTSPEDEPLTVTDKNKTSLLYRPKPSEAIKEGNAPCVFYPDKTESRALFTSHHQTGKEKESDTIQDAKGVVLGQLELSANHKGNVLDEKSNVIAAIQEKNAFKNNLLFEILKPGESSDNDPILKMVVPHHYAVSIRGQKAMELKEDASAIRSDYSLKKSVEISEKEENLLLVCLMLALTAKY
jgi:hypothetical protein